MHVQLGQIIDLKYKTTKTQLPLLKNQSLDQKQGFRVLGAKTDYCECSLHIPPPANPLSHPSSPNPNPPHPISGTSSPMPCLGEWAQETVTWFWCPLKQQGSQNGLAWISCLMSYQSLRIKEDHKTWSVTICSTGIGPLASAVTH